MTESTKPMRGKPVGPERSAPLAVLSSGVHDGRPGPVPTRHIMRRSVLGICVGFPLLCFMVACSSDDNSDSVNSPDSGIATAGNGGTGGAAGYSGGTSIAGSNAGGNSAGSGGSGGDTDDAGTASDASDAGPMTAPAIYVMTNGAAANDVLGFFRAPNGTLTPMEAPFSTGGKGSGAGLGEQGAVAYD